MVTLAKKVFLGFLDEHSRHGSFEWFWSQKMPWDFNGLSNSRTDHEEYEAMQIFPM